MCDSSAILLVSTSKRLQNRTESGYLDRLRADAAFAEFRLEEVRTDFEFLLNSNYYLRLVRR